MHTRDDLTADLRTLGLAPGDVVMVHASVRAVGEVAGGPDEIHLALKDVLTGEGTILMYAGCPRYVDEIGRGNLTPEQEAEMLDKLPAFDPVVARSARDNGVLVEFFRTYPGTRANQHVTRFVAWGKESDLLLGQSPWDYAFGHDSVLDRLAKLDGKILLLGSDHDNVTFLHYAEHVAPIPDKIVARFKVPVMDNGARVWKTMEEFDTSERAHANWPDKFFAMIVDSYLESTGNEGGLVGSAQSYVMSAPALAEFAIPLMEAIARDASALSRLRPA